MLREARENDIYNRMIIMVVIGESELALLFMFFCIPSISSLEQETLLS